MATNSNFIKNLFFLSLTVCSLQAVEPVSQKTWAARFMGSIGQSSVMEFCSKNIQTKIDRATTHKFLNYGDEPASQKYQELGSQAQFALKVPQDRHLPVKKLNPASQIASLVGAVAESNAIYVNEGKLDKRTYGAARCALFHEAVHTKYHDKTVDGMMEWVVLIGGSVATNSALKALNINAWRKRVSFMMALGLTMHASSMYQHFMERRADIEGHLATQCSSCVLEHAEHRKQLFEEEKSPLKDNGYLWSAKLEEIAQDLGDKKCTYHQTNSK